MFPVIKPAARQATTATINSTISIPKPPLATRSSVSPGQTWRRLCRRERAHRNPGPSHGLTRRARRRADPIHAAGATQTALGHTVKRRLETAHREALRTR
ncbi:hypothetical protein GCM10023321_32750 [Pseudonocardia eucalypti]|uniref:Uncharacterized protein n=1 Tax=Pseudonocardia eucalypti TaxID=648755 RepID=A0ABP9Q4F2_9PSEU